jgi:hypothetical protein
MFGHSFFGEGLPIHVFELDYFLCDTKFGVFSKRRGKEKALICPIEKAF